MRRFFGKGQEARERREQAEEQAVGDLPDVLFLEDVAKLLRCSPSTVKRRLRARIFPVPPLPGIDKRPRWSKAALLRWIEVGGSGTTERGRRRRTA